MRLKNFQSSEDWLKSTVLNIVLLLRSILTTNIALVLSRHKKCLKTPQESQENAANHSEMILVENEGQLIPDSEDDAVDVIAGLIEQGFHDLASEYRDFIICRWRRQRQKV